MTCSIKNQLCSTRLHLRSTQYYQYYKTTHFHLRSTSRHFFSFGAAAGGERPDKGRTNLSKYLPFCIFGILYLPFAYFVFCICLCIFCIFLSHQSNIVMWSKFCPSAFKCLLCSIVLSSIFNTVAISFVRVNWDYIRNPSRSMVVYQVL